MGADNEPELDAELDAELDSDLDSDLDEATRIVTRGAEPSVFDDATRVVAKGSEPDDATRVVTRRAAAAAPPTPVITDTSVEGHVAAEPSVAAPIVASSKAAGAVPALAERYFPTSVAEPELDEATRIVRRPAPAPATAAQPEDDDADDNDATRIVRRAPTSPAPAVAAPAAVPEPSEKTDDDATRIVRRPVPEAEPVDDSTRIVRRAASAVGTVPGSDLDESAGEDTRVVVRGGASAQKVAETPLPPVTVPTASAVQTPPEREVYSPRAVPEQQPLQRTHIEASSRPPAAAASAGAQARRRLVIAVSAIAGVAVLGAVIAAAVVLIAAL